MGLSAADAEENLIIQYLLGVLPEAEQYAVETQIFANSRYFDLMLTVEDDLIESYLLGFLREAELRLFEQAFLGSPARRKQLLQEKSLMDTVSRKPRRVSQVREFGEGEVFLPFQRMAAQ